MKFKPIKLEMNLWTVLKLALTAALLVCVVMVCVMTQKESRQQEELRAAEEAAALTAALATPTPAPTAEPSPTPAPTPMPAPTPLPEFVPAATEETKASNTIKSTLMEINGAEKTSYTAAEGDRIDFASGSDYTAVKGIVGFRGNNFRDTAQYGTANIDSGEFGAYWNIQTDGKGDIEGAYWCGSGWTGQPMAVEWPAETKAVMNMYGWAKEKEGLVEVIYPTLDGKVYFLDLETGSDTRKPLDLGFSFKGTGTLDPRGYPILYIGGGLTNANGGVPRIMVVSLIDGSILYEIGNNDSFAPRWWFAFDAGPLVDAESDQLIYPSESGVLYIIKLNTRYDEAAGELSVKPSQVIKWKYEAEDIYRYGIEASPVIWRSHAFLVDNSGNFFCLDLNTLTVEWCVDVLDDTNCTPLLELDENGHPYLYISTSFRYGLRGYYNVDVPVWKIDGVTGETVWRNDYSCYTENGVSGGSQASFAMGTGELDGILYVAMARHPEPSTGLLLALDSETGEELWTYECGYAWSTPTCFYDQNGKGYVLYVSSVDGSMYLLDGLSGEVLDSFYFGETMEASPIVYDNTVVIGTRMYDLYGITLK